MSQGPPNGLMCQQCPYKQESERRRDAPMDLLDIVKHTRPKTVGCGDVGKIAGEMEETLSEMQPCSCSKGHFMYGCRHSVVRLISLAKRLRSLAGEGE